MGYLNKLAAALVLLAAHNSIFAQTVDPPINSGEILTEALKFSQEKKYDEAIADFLKIDENDTNYVDASLELANTYLAAGNDSTAIILCDKMLEEKNQYEQSFYIIKGSALDDAKKFDQALKVYNEGLVKYPKSYMLYFNIGLAYLRKKDFANAEINFIKALSINPYHASSHLRLASAAFHQSKLAPSILSYMFFLQLENTTKRAGEAVVRMEKILKREVEPEGTAAVAGETDDFADLEALIKSKVALNGKYKSKIDLQFDMVKQLQLFFEKLKYNPSDKGFWMQTYVPFFTALQKEGYFEDMIYGSLRGVDNEVVNKWLKSHESKETKFAEWAATTLESTVANFEEDMNGKKEKVGHYYYSNYKIQAIGNINNKKAVGYWKYYFKSGYLKSEGPFDQNGEREGFWKYYYDNGQIKEEANFKHGVLSGAYTKYHTNGSKELTAKYEKDLYTGPVETYYLTNALHGSYNFKEGKKEGKEISYYPNGAKKYEVGNVNSSAEGPFIQYYPSGKTQESYSFVNNKRTGAFTTYYPDGAKKSEGTYKDDIATGPYKAYYSNGKIKEEGPYNDKGLLAGLWKKYDMQGRLTEEILYSEKGKINSHKYFTTKGKVENELIFKSEELVQAKSYDENGTIINDQKKKGKNFNVTFFRANGNKRSDGAYVDGERDGEWKFYNEDGYLSGLETYKAGLLEGKNFDYFSNGKIKNESEYKNNVIDGLYKAYYVNGALERQGYYTNGTEQGYWYYYQRDGKMSEKRYYLNGESFGKELTFAANGKKYKEDYSKDGYVTKLLYFDSTGKMLNRSDFPFGSGTINYSHLNGKPRLKAEYKNGLSEGTFTWLYPNGKIETQINYVNSKKEDAVTFYYEDGTKSKEENYLNGELNGPLNSYYENGVLHEKHAYVNDDKHGIQNTFYENKVLYRSANYIYGKAEGPLRYYSEDGQLVISKYYENDLLKSYSYLNKSGKYDSIPVKNETGKIVAYYANGQKSIEFDIEYGYYTGKRFEYYPTGKIKKDENFYVAEFDGLQKQYYSNGNLKSEENYLIGTKHGYAKYFYENGKIKQEGKYLNGNKFGDWKQYDAMGKLVKKTRYYDDVEIPN